MKRKYIFLFFLLFMITHSFSQKLTREFVDNWVKSKDSTFKWEVNTMYLIKNKNYYYRNNDNIDSAISCVSFDELIDLWYMIPTIKPYSPISYNVFIETKYQMTDEQLTSWLHNAKLNIGDKKRVDSIDFYLNDKLIEPTKVFDLIHSLKVPDIYYMKDFNPRNRRSYFTAGLRKYQLKIWTKKRD